MSEAVPIAVPGSSSHPRGSFAPRGGSAGSKGKGRAPAPASSSAGAGGASAGERKPKKFRHRKTKEEVEFEKEGKRLAAGGDGGLGVNKLKAALRQARRLVAKEGLPADVKTETERKIKGLELDLERALGRNEEKKNATRYHMVKFFERQKLLRRLRPLLKTLASDPPSTKKQLAKLQQEVEGLRVGLNYVLNYPNSLKYISLFPPKAGGAGGSDVDDVESDDDDEAGAGRKSAPLLNVPKEGAGKSDLKRSELVEKVRTMMAAGELSAKPEEEILAAGDGDDAKGKRKRIAVDNGKAGGKKAKAGGAEPSAIAEDDFFGGGSDSE